MQIHIQIQGVPWPSFDQAKQKLQTITNKYINENATTDINTNTNAGSSLARLGLGQQKNLPKQLQTNTQIQIQMQIQIQTQIQMQGVPWSGLDQTNKKTYQNNYNLRHKYKYKCKYRHKYKCREFFSEAWIKPKIKKLTKQ